MNEVVIYALCEPGTGMVRYIGKALDLTARLRSHKWEAVSSKLQTHKVRWLRSLGDREPTVVVLDRVTNETWQDAERAWIQDARAAGFDLTNVAPGGQTSPVEGRGHTEATNRLLREQALARGSRPPSRRGVRTSAETRAKLRETMLRIGHKPPKVGGWNKGLKMSAAAVEANRQGHLGIPWSPARRAAQEMRRKVAAGE